jgi:predicted dehydrogenase
MIMEPRLAIIGCGLVGRKRLENLPRGSVTVLCDQDLQRAGGLAVQSPGCLVTDSVEQAVNSADVDAVVIATPHGALCPIAMEAVRAGKHVLVEKPAGTGVAQLELLEALAEERGTLVRVGYTLRHHRACRKALEIFRSGVLGPMMFVRGRYGHGGRPGYETEWRADPLLSGGGELIDQGVHLIDLARMFLGDFTTVEGHVATSFWNMPVEDNAFLSLRTRNGTTAWLHASCCEWKNLFSLEVYGRQGKLHWEGLGGSYGVERLAHHAMLPQMGPPETEVWEFPQSDDSWKVENDEFLEDIRKGRQPEPGLKDAMAVLDVVEKIYEKNLRE